MISRRSQRGFSLLQIIVAAGLMASLGVAMMQMMGGMNRGMASLQQKGDFEEVRAMLRHRLSCQNTFKDFTCATHVGPQGQVILRDNYDKVIFNEYGVAKAGAPKWDVFINSYVYGNARVRAQCVAGAVEISWANYLKPETAWPPKAQVATCQEVLGGPVTNVCPAGQKMMGVNKDTLSPICVPELTVGCPVGQYMRSIDFSQSPPLPQCANVSTGCTIPGQMVISVTNDAAGNLIATCSNKPNDIEAKENALEATQKNMVSRKCHRLNNYSNYTATNAPMTGIRGFEDNGEPLCAPVAGDYNGDGYGDVVIMAGPTGGPRVTMRMGPNGDTAGWGGDFFAYETFFRGGANAGLVDVNGDGFADIMSGAGPGGGPRYRAYFAPVNLGAGVGPNGDLNSQWNGFAFEPWFTGGIIMGP